MRIARLDLMAVGPFTDRTIEFSPAADRAVDVVFGPNEAGKSSCLRALDALLFGFEARTTDNFRHEHRALRVGAELVREDDGARLAFVRRKGARNTLLAPDGSALPDDLLTPWLQGTDRGTFRSLFGLDRDELAEGSREILAGHGHVGEALFSAGLGAAGVHLRRVLERLGEEADAIYRPRGRRQRLNAALATLADLRREVRARSVLPARWKELDAGVRQREEAFDAVEAEVGNLEAERHRLTRFVEAFERATRLRALDEALPASARAAPLPADFAERFRTAEPAAREAASAVRQLSAERDELLSALGELEVREDLVAERDALELEVRKIEAFVSSVAEQPSRHARLESLQASVAREFLDAFPGRDRSEAGTVSRDRPAESGVRALAAEAGEWARRLERAAGAVEGLAQRVRELGARIDGEGGRSGVDRAALAAALEAARRAADTAAEHGRLESELRRATGARDGRFARLPAWEGTLDELLAFRAPSPETMRRFRDRIVAAERAEAEARERLAACTEEVAACGAERRALELGGEVATPADLRDARAARDAAWRSLLEGDFRVDAHREAFLERMREADRLADLLREEADRVSRFQQLIETSVELEARHERWLAEVEARSADLRSESAAWEREWSGFAGRPGTPQEMLDWLDHRDAILRDAATIREAESGLVEIETRVREAGELLRAALAGSGVECRAGDPLDVLIGRGAEVLERHDRATALREQFREAESRLAEARRTLEPIEAGRAAWEESWRRALEAAGLPRSTRPEELEGLLAQRERFFERREALAEAETACRSVESAIAAFAERAVELAGRLAPEAVDRPPDEIVNHLIREANAHVTRAAKRDDLASRLEATEARLASERRRGDEARRELEDLAAAARCGSPERLADVVTRVELAAGLAPLAGGSPVEAFAEEAASLDPDEIAARLEAIEARLATLREARQDAARALAEARHAKDLVDGGEEAAVLASRAEEVAASIREDSERYARLVVAESLLRDRIERFRTSREQPILEAASRIFAELTCGSFAGIAAAIGDDDQAVLVGIRASGAAGEAPGEDDRVGVAGMSEGTRDQLYLALRLAALESFLDRHGPLPLVVDDLLVTFDDERAAAIFKVFARLAARTQVIVFTHHRHLVEVGREAIGDARLHFLQLA